MRNLPQEIVNLIIDELHELLGDPDYDFEPPIPHYGISKYSTVSRRWVTRTRQHHFKLLSISNTKYLQRWDRAFSPDSTPHVSRYVKTLDFFGVDTLEGFGGHLKAFTHVKDATFDGCDIFCSSDTPSLLEPLGTRLVTLTIDASNVLPKVMAEFLSLLPCLRRFDATDLTPDSRQNLDPKETLPAIPFFEKGEGDFRLSLDHEDYSLEAPSWIPPTARFESLAVEASLIRDSPGILNGWIISSGETLKHLNFSADQRLDGSSLSPVDLSKCTSLETLRLPVLPTNPGIVADITLSSVTSLKLSRVVLDLKGDHDSDHDPQDWEPWGEHLCRLAKRFQAAHNGIKMVVEVRITRSHALLAKFQKENPMPGLDGRATIVVE